jgi:hypothetical protein
MVRTTAAATHSVCGLGFGAWRSKRRETGCHRVEAAARQGGLRDPPSCVAEERRERRVAGSGESSTDEGGEGGTTGSRKRGDGGAARRAPEGAARRAPGHRRRQSVGGGGGTERRRSTRQDHERGSGCAVALATRECGTWSSRALLGRGVAGFGCGYDRIIGKKNGF